MKAAAAICIASAGIWLGLFLRDRLNGRVKILQRLCALLREMENRTAILHLSLPQTVRSLSRNESFAAFSFLAACADQCENGTSFSAAWHTSVAAFLKKHGLHGNGAQMLPQLGASLTCVNETQIERLIAYYLQALQDDLRQAQLRLQTTGKLDVYLCTGGGILLGIMVL